MGILSSRSHQVDRVKKHHAIIKGRRLSIRSRKKLVKTKAYNRMRNSRRGDDSPKSSGF